MFRFERIMQMSAVPESVKALWDKGDPQVKVGCESSIEELFSHYLYIDKETRKKRGFKPGFDVAFHQFQLAKVALETGCLKYDQIRVFVHEALAYPYPEGLIVVYAFWMGLLRKEVPTNLETFNDMRRLEFKAIEALKKHKNPNIRAFYLTQIITHAEEKIPEERVSSYIDKVIEDLEIKYCRNDFFDKYDVWNLEREERKASNNFVWHGNDIIWLDWFVTEAVKRGKADKFANLSNALENFLIKCDLRGMDRGIVESLMEVSTKKTLVSKEVSEVFRTKVRNYARKFEGLKFGAKKANELFGALASHDFASGRKKQGFLMLNKIHDEVQFNITAGQYLAMKNVDLTKLDKLHAGWDEGSWMFQVCLAAITRYSNGDTSLLNSQVVKKFISSGGFDFELDWLMGAIKKGDPNEEMEEIVRQRLSQLELDDKNLLKAAMAMKKKG